MQCMGRTTLEVWSASRDFSRPPVDPDQHPRAESVHGDNRCRSLLGPRSGRAKGFVSVKTATTSEQATAKSLAKGSRDDSPKSKGRSGASAPALLLWTAVRRSFRETSSKPNRLEFPPRWAVVFFVIASRPEGGAAIRKMAGRPSFVEILFQTGQKRVQTARGALFCRTSKRFQSFRPEIEIRKDARGYV